MDSFDGEVSFVYESAQGNVAIASQIAQKFAGMNLDLIVPISTPSAQSIINIVHDTPIVFAAVSDPIAAGIIKDVNRPGGYVTGVMDIPPLEKQIEFILELLQETNTIGYPHNPGEANSEAVLRRLINLAKVKNLEIVPIAINKSADVGIACQQMIGNVDVIFIIY